ncbi:MAG TPA: DUF885 family protein [Terriglobales bacterium]|jgi:uncharacterized protein (DUF885 family)|nr:DUF885 family protein [Terriglobales bacterium]
MRYLSYLVLLAIPVVFIFAARSDQAADTQSLSARHAQFTQLLADEWEYEMRESPEYATQVGDNRYNDRWSDYSLEHQFQQGKDAQQWLARFQAVNTAGFSEQEKLSAALMIRGLKERIEGINLKTFEMPIDQFNGIHLGLAQVVDSTPFNSVKDYEDYLSRLHKLPLVFDQIIGLLQHGEKDGLMPPKYLLEKTVDQCKKLAQPEGEANPFGRPVTKFPDSIPGADRKRLHDAIILAVNDQVRPAYTKLANFIATDYAPKGRTEPGVWSLPNGDALYRYDIRVLTTTSMDPEQIHEIGLKEVERIEGEELAIAKKLGFNDLKSFRAELKHDPKVFATSPDGILEKYRGYIDQMRPELPKLFGLLPKTPVEVQAMQAYRAADAAGADYQQGTPDGSRHAVVWVNTSDYKHREMMTAESTAYHEGIPGHHMQIAIAQTLPEVPKFRQEAFYSAYQEGWALYAERLGKDVGFYQDPYSDFGRLEDEMLRAIRLVTDTGVHYKHWTRQQMVDFFHEHSSTDEPNVQAETDRYIVWPAQALGYKLGQLEILKLRDRAKNELGAKFDIRTFHDEVLDAGALPLDVFDQRVNAWIDGQKSAAGGAH